MSDEWTTAAAELAGAKAALDAGHAYENTRDDESARRENLRENSSRPASVDMTYIATGIGQRRVAKPLIFPIKFRTEPTMLFGFSCIKNPDYKKWHDPIAAAGVYAWKRDNRGHYLGAFIYVRIELYPLDFQAVDEPGEAARIATFASLSNSSTDNRALSQVKTQIYMTFSAVGMKLVPTSSQTTSKTREPGVN